MTTRLLLSAGLTICMATVSTMAAEPVATGAPATTPSFNIHVDREKLTRLGLTATDVGDAVKKHYDDAAAAGKEPSVESIVIVGKDGRRVKLTDVATVKLGPATLPAGGNDIVKLPAPTPATGPAPKAGILSFRIAPQREGSAQGGLTLTKAEVEKHLADFAAKGPDAGRDSGAKYLWFELLASEGGPIVATKDGRKYVLLSNEPGRIMVPVKDGKDAWGIKRVAETKDHLNNPAVDVVLDDAGGRMMGDLTRNNIGNAMALLIDDRVVAIPVIRAEISGHAQITGKYTQEQVRDLVKALRDGVPPKWLDATQPQTQPQPAK